MFETRPWGGYEVLSDEPTHKVKRLTVEPGQRLSYQRHAHRSADDAFLGEARVEHALVAELFLKSLGDQMYAALAANVLAEHEHFRIHLEFMAQGASNRVREAQQLAVF